MVTYVRSVMKSSIEQAGWMDQQTKSKALEKLEQMTQKTGYPEYIFNETRLMEGMEEVLWVGLKLLIRLYRIRFFSSTYLQTVIWQTPVA